MSRMRSSEYVELADNCTETPSIVGTKKSNFPTPQLPLEHACSSESQHLYHCTLNSKSILHRPKNRRRRKEEKGAKTYDERSSLSTKAACVPALSRSRH